MPHPWDAETYARAFRVRVRDPKAPDYGQVIGYGRRFAEIVQDPPWSFYIDRARWLVDVLAERGLKPSARVIVFGVGFGFLLDVLDRRGFPNVWGVDSSPYVQGRFDLEKPNVARVQFRDVTKITRQELAQLLTAWTGDWHFDAIVTETLLEGYGNAVINAALDTFEDALTTDDTKRIVHFVHCATPQSLEHGYHDLSLGLRWQTLDEWAALRPDHTWIDWASGEVR